MHREGTERDEVKEGRCENGGRRKGVKRGLASLIIHMNCVVGGGGCKLSGGGGRGGEFTESVFCSNISRHIIQAQLQQG